MGRCISQAKIIGASQLNQATQSRRFVSQLTRETVARVLAGEHIYRMDYGPMLAPHVNSNADLTVGCVEVPRTEASAFGVLGVDASGLSGASVPRRLANLILTARLVWQPLAS